MRLRGVYQFRVDSPIVNDGITWREKENYEGHGRRAKRYDTYEGTTKTTLVAKKKDGRG